MIDRVKRYSGRQEHLAQLVTRFVAPWRVQPEMTSSAKRK